MTDQLATVIDAAWDDRANVSVETKGEVRDAVEEALAMLDSGKARVAEKVGGEWVTNQWLKKAVLLSFRLADNAGCHEFGALADAYASTLAHS